MSERKKTEEDRRRAFVEKYPPPYTVIYYAPGVSKAIMHKMQCPNLSALETEITVAKAACAAPPSNDPKEFLSRAVDWAVDGIAKEELVDKFDSRQRHITEQTALHG